MASSSKLFLLLVVGVLVCTSSTARKLTSLEVSFQDEKTLDGSVGIGVDADVGVGVGIGVGVGEDIGVGDGLGGGSGDGSGGEMP
ncbi:hypothetical protein R6Q59_009649 [Mikania micrantha]